LKKIPVVAVLHTTLVRVYFKKRKKCASQLGSFTSAHHLGAIYNSLFAMNKQTSMISKERCDTLLKVEVFKVKVGAVVKCCFQFNDLFPVSK